MALLQSSWQREAASSGRLETTEPLIEGRVLRDPCGAVRLWGHDEEVTRKMVQSSTRVSVSSGLLQLGAGREARQRAVREVPEGGASPAPPEEDPRQQGPLLRLLPACHRTQVRHTHLAARGPHDGVFVWDPGTCPTWGSDGFHLLHLLKLPVQPDHRSVFQAPPHRCGVHEEIGEDREHRPGHRQSRHADHRGTPTLQRAGEGALERTFRWAENTQMPDIM